MQHVPFRILCILQKMSNSGSFCDKLTPDTLPNNWSTKAKLDGNLLTGEIPWRIWGICLIATPLAKPAVHYGRGGGEGKICGQTKDMPFWRRVCGVSSDWGPRKAKSGQKLFPRASERRVLPIVGACKTSSHLHISSSHLLIFTSSHLHIFSSSHLLTSSHLHIFSSSHLLTFTSSHLLTFTSSHLLIFTSSHLHIFSHLLTSSHIFSHLLTSSLTSSHIFSHLLTPLALLPSCLLALLSSCLLALLPSCPLLLFYFSFEGGSRGSGNETPRNATLSHEMRFDRQKLR